MKEDTLILVYNAHSGIFSAASDFVKRLTHPDKYDCALCDVTYGKLKMQHPWKEYLSSLPQRKRFMYQDKFQKEFPELEIGLPSILIQCSDQSPVELVSATEITGSKNLQELIVRMSEKLSEGGYPCGTLPH